MSFCGRRCAVLSAFLFFLNIPSAAAQEITEGDALRRFERENAQARALSPRVRVVRAETRTWSLPPRPAVTYNREDAASGAKKDFLLVQFSRDQAKVVRVHQAEPPRVSESAARRQQAPTFENPTGAISLRDVIALALLHSPDLAAFAWETRAREARILQAGRPPNPVATIVAQDLWSRRLFPGGNPSQEAVQPQATIELSQVIELGGKRTARRNLAALNRDLAGWDYEAARINVLTQVTRTFIDVLAAQEMVTLTTQTTQLVEQVQQSVHARVVAGVASPIEETKAEVALSAARLESDRARRVLDASRRQLVAFWGATEAKFQSAVGDLAEIQELPSLAELNARVSGNPDLARWAAEISQRQAELALEKARRVPDVTMTAGYRRYTAVDSNALVIGGSIALPIFNRNKGAVEEANRRLSKAYEERRAAEARASALLAEAYRALSSAHQEVTTLRSEVRPLAQRTFEAVSEGYRLGKFGYLDVLDAQRTLIGAGAQHLRALSDYHKAVADVERLIGAPLNGTTSVPTPKE